MGRGRESRARRQMARRDPGGMALAGMSMFPSHKQNVAISVPGNYAENDSRANLIIGTKEGTELKYPEDDIRNSVCINLGGFGLANLGPLELLVDMSDGLINLSRLAKDVDVDAWLKKSNTKRVIRAIRSVHGGTVWKRIATEDAFSDGIYGSVPLFARFIGDTDKDTQKFFLGGALAYMTNQLD